MQIIHANALTKLNKSCGEVYQLAIKARDLTGNERIDLTIRRSNNSSDSERGARARSEREHCNNNNSHSVNRLSRRD